MNQEKIKELEQSIHNHHSNITGMIIQKSGVTLYENYWNGYTAHHAVHVASVTKSVVSALIGIALEKGLIQSVEQKVLEFFPYYKVRPGETTIQSITIKHLLTMTAPYRYKTEPYQLFFTSQNPILDALNLLGGDDPIGEFRYSAIGGTHILSGILAKATGGSILDFATENLFSPLGISVPQNIIMRNEQEHFAVMNDKNTTGWAVDAQGFHTASWGLFLTPADMTKIGQLYCNGGIWNGKQIVPANWVAHSTKEQSRCEQLGLAYGYLWWVIDPNSYAALGDGGNVIYVNTKTKMVIAIAALLTPDAKDRIELIQTQIEPTFQD